MLQQDIWIHFLTFPRSNIIWLWLWNNSPLHQSQRSTTSSAPVEQHTGNDDHNHQCTAKHTANNNPGHIFCFQICCLAAQCLADVCHHGRERFINMACIIILPGELEHATAVPLNWIKIMGNRTRIRKRVFSEYNLGLQVSISHNCLNSRGKLKFPTCPPNSFHSLRSSMLTK